MTRRLLLAPLLRAVGVWCVFVGVWMVAGR